MESLFDVAKCEDEAVLAMALRKHAKDFVGVADDGKSLFLKDHDTLMDALEDWDSKCVYLVSAWRRLITNVQSLNL